MSCCFELQIEQLADEVKDALSATAMKFAVRFYAVHKPVRFQDPLHKSLSHSEKLINKDSDDHRPPEKKAFNVDYTTRLGAFEVQVAIKTRKDFICHLLFSKLFRGVWPKVSSLQKLLERLLSEARFNRLDSDGPSENSSPKSRKFGMRRQSTKVTLLPKTAMEEDEVSELHAEFDLRDKEPPQLEQPPFTLQVSFMEQSPWSDTGREGNNSTSVCEDGIAADTDAPTGFSSTTPAISSGPDAAIAAATELSAAPASDSARLDAGADAVSEDEVEAAYQRYQELLRVAQLQRGEASSSSAAQESPSGKDRILTRVGSAKAAIRALGYASVGLQLIRSKTQSAKDPVHAGLISPERAMEIANETHSNRVPGASEADDDPNAHFTKKGSSIGVLSRQNAGGGKGRFLHVDDEDAAAEEAAFGPPGQMLPASPPPGAMLTRGSSMASGAPSNSSFGRSNSTVSISAVSSAKAPYNRGSSTVSVTPFSDTSSKLQKLNLAVDDVGEDEDQIGFSPTNSSKSSVPTTAAALTTKGSSLVRHRSASISALAVAPTEIAKMKMSRNKAQSEKSLGGVRQGSPKNGQHRPHPSLEMRKKLDIGMLSRQTAAKGGKLVVPDDDSDGDGDGAGSDLSDSAPPTPLKKFTNAMKEAVDAVNAATEVSNDQKATLTAEDTKVAHTTAANHPPHVTVAAIPPYAAHRAVVHPEEATETVAPDATSRNNPRTSEGTTHTAHASANNTDQVQVKEAVLPHSALPSLVASEEVHHHQHQHQQPEIPVPNLEVSATSPAESDTAAPAAAPVVAEATQVSPPSDVPVAPKLSAAEILQTRRHMTEQLLSDVSKDILKRANSSQEDGGYGDDFEDLEDSLSPTRGGNNNNNGFEDLFDAAEFQLSQISEGTQERG